MSIKMQCDSCWKYSWAVFHGTLNKKAGAYCQKCVDDPDLDIKIAHHPDRAKAFWPHPPKDNSGDKS